MILPECLSAGEVWVTLTSTPPDGWTYTSISSSGGYANFNAVGDSILSPLFSDDIQAITLVYTCSNLAATRGLHIQAQGRAEVVLGEEMPLPMPAAASTETSVELAMPAGTHRILFVLRGSGSTGNWSLHRIGFHGIANGVSVPTALYTRAVTNDGFTAGWTRAADTVAVLFDLAQESEVRAQGDAVWRETLAGVTNASPNAVTITNRFDAVLDQAGWTGELVYAAGATNGVVQIGTGKKWGRWTSPILPSGSGRSVLFRAKRYAADGEGTAFPFELMAGEETNAAWSVTLCGEFRDYLFSLPDLTGGERLVFHSMTNNQQGRVWVSGVALVTNGVAACTVTNLIAQSVRVETAETNVTALVPGPYVWTVRGVDATNGVSAAADWQRVVVGGTEETASDAGLPEAVPVAMSGFVSGGTLNWYEDFTSWSNVTKETVLTAGVIPANWFILRNGLSAAAIGHTTGSSTKSLPYVCSVEEDEESYSFGVLTSGDNGYSYGFGLSNDTGRTIHHLSVGFDAIQWSQRAVAKTVRCEAAVTVGTRPDETSELWQAVTSVSTPFTGTGKKALYERTTIAARTVPCLCPADSVLWVRWVDEKGTSLPILAIDNVAVTGAQRPSAGILRVR